MKQGMNKLLSPKFARETFVPFETIWNLSVKPATMAIFYSSSGNEEELKHRKNLTGTFLPFYNKTRRQKKFNNI